MAKLSQLLTLERMLDAYDNMKTKDAWIIEKHALCTGELLDSIIVTLVRQLKSKTRLSCRNVLVANFNTMTKTAHWLRCKLFTDLPKEMGQALREKVVQMVDLLKALMVKIINVDEFADEFFERLKNRYLKKKHTSDYELWKARQSKITIKRLVRYQVELTAEMLSSGIMKYAETPNGEEIQNVDKDKLALTLTDKGKITESFINECAKLRRYSHWEGDMFMIDYELLRKYLYCIFGKLTSEQHIKMFEYDVQMKQIHEDIWKLMKGHEEEELKEERKMEEKKELNYTTPRLVLQNMLKAEKVRPVFNSPKKYTKEWSEQFVVSLMATEHGAYIAKKWEEADQRSMLKGFIFGLLKEANVLKESRLGIARAYLGINEKSKVPELVKQVNTFASYMSKSRWKNEPFADWVLDYVRSQEEG